jgi:hypothetical protein
MDSTFFQMSTIMAIVNISWGWACCCGFIFAMPPL